jgi:hypothetical protein
MHSRFGTVERRARRGGHVRCSTQRSSNRITRSNDQIESGCRVRCGAELGEEGGVRLGRVTENVAHKDVIVDVDSVHTRQIALYLQCK